MEMNGQLHSLAALTWGKSHQYPFNRRLGLAPKARLGRVKDVTIFATAGNHTILLWSSSPQPSR